MTKMEKRLANKLEELAYAYATDMELGLQQHLIRVFEWEHKPHILDVRVRTEFGFVCCNAEVPASELSYRALKALKRMLVPDLCWYGEPRSRSCVLRLKEE